MYTIEEFCHMVDDEKPDILQQLRKKKLIPKYCKSIKDLSKSEQKQYDREHFRLMKSYSRQKTWRKVMRNNLRYDKPYLANIGCLVTEKDTNIAKMDKLVSSDSGGSSTDGALTSDAESSSEESSEHES